METKIMKRTSLQVLGGIMIAIIVLILFVQSASAATPIYVRPDGDDVNCDGTADVAYPGSGGPGLACAVQTINKGIGLVDAGGTVNVAAGTYAEYVVINKDLTLNGETGAIIQKPSGYDVYYKLPDEGTTKSFRPIVLAYGGSITGGDGTTAVTAYTIQGTGTVNVTVSGFSIQANNSWTGATSSNFADAILFRNVVGTITTNSIEDMLPSDTNQFTLGIEVRGDNSIVTMSDNILTEFGRVGVLIAGNLGTPVATITGNTVTAVYFGDYVTNGIEVNYRSTGTISNNTVTGATGEGTDWAGGGIMVTDADNVTISGNNVSDCDVGISVGGRLNYGYVANNNVVEGNTLADNLYSSIEVNTNAKNTTIRNNTITGVAARTDTEEAGIVILEYSNPLSGYPDGVLIEGNSISGDPGFWGIDIYRNVDNVTIQNNIVTGGAVAVALELKETNSVGKNLTIGGATSKANSFSGQTVLAISTGPYDYSGVPYQWTPDVNASGNWFGTSTSAGVAALVSANVDYTPWLVSGTDTSTDPGFQGDFSSLWVDDDSPQTGTSGRIQEGVDLVSGSTVNVASGTYTQTVNIEGKTGLTINGEDKTTVILQPTSTLCLNVGGYGCSRTAALRAVNSTDLLLQNITFDYSIIKGNFVHGLLLWDSTGTVNNNIIKNMSAPDTSAYYEITSYVRAPSYTDTTRAQVAFTGNSFIDTGRLAIVTHDFVHTTISGNTFHKDMDDFGYAMEIGSRSTATVSNNIIDGYDTPAASDGSQSAGIYIENAFTGGMSGVTKNVSLSDNEIYDCQWALYVGNEFNGYAGDVDIVVSTTDNNFHDNIDGAVVITDEDKSAGSSVNYTGSGNTLTDNGDVGYFIYTWGDGDVTVSLDDETISGNDIGVYLNDYAATPPSGSSYNVEIHGSSIAGNTSYGVQNDYADTTIDAELNWWGCPCGPSGEGPGSGDAVSTNVTFSPWWTTSTGGSGSSSGLVVPNGATLTEEQAILDCAAPGSTILFESGVYPGGMLVHRPQLTLDVNGCTIGHGTPAFTVTAADTIIQGPGILDGDLDTSPAILVQTGGDNLIVQDMEIREWQDGIHFANAVESLKIVNNWIHSNDDDGLQVDAAPTGVVTIEGNLFKVNGDVGAEYNGATGTLDATYNSWGDDAGPTGPLGDGVGPNVLYEPWTFSEIYFDLDPETTGDQFTRRVAETNVFDVAIMGDAENLYGLSFVFSFDSSRLALNSTTFTTPWTDKCTALGGLPAGQVGYFCNLTSDPEWDGGKIATFNFTATNSGDAYFDVFSDTSLSSGAKGGVKVFVNNAGYNDPSTTDRLITDTDDGKLIIDDIANFTGFIDLQGRANDAGALLAVYDALSGGTLMATATSASSGKYTTVYESGQLLLVSTTTPLYSVPYYLYVDRALYLPSPSPYVSALLYSSPTTSLYQLLLLGGDGTDDNTIDLGDAACIGSAYGSSSNNCTGGAGANSDVNEDGIVNIYDLTLMGGNFTLSTSIWVPQ